MREMAGMIVMTGCPPTLPLAIVKPNTEAKNEVIVTNELRTLLAEKPRPKLVIRVSNPPANVTEAEKFNAYINLIEKNLMQNSFTVRDNRWYRSLWAPIDSEEIKTYFVNYLAQKLMDQLLESINRRMKEFVDLYRAGSYTEGQAILTELMAKDPNNYVIYVGQSLLNAHRGDFSGAQRQLETAGQKASNQYQRAVVAYGYARVYALKNEKETALSFLRKAFQNGLAMLVKLPDIRSNPDLANIADSAEFDALLAEFEKAPAGEKK